MYEGGVVGLVGDLIAQQGALTGVLQQLREGERQVFARLAGMRSHPADIEQDTSLEAVYAHRGAVVTRQLRGLDRSLRRLHTGKTIRCARCKAELTEERLHIAQGTRRCVGCQERYELRRRRSSGRVSMFGKV